MYITADILRVWFLMGFISGYCLSAFINVAIVAVLAFKMLRVAYAAALQAERLAQKGTAEISGAPPGGPKEGEA